MKYIKINENGIHIVFGITDKNQIKLLHFSKAEFDENDICKFGKECKAEDLVRKEQFIDEAFQLVQVNLAGYNRPYEKHGNKHICTAPGYLLTYAGMEDSWNEFVLGSSGKILDIMEARIYKESPEAETGEIQVRGENVMVGYYKNPEATNEVFTEDGWLRTGDLGTMDANGNIFIRGRLKTMILSSSGQNIFPEELETKLNNLPFILESLVIEYNKKLVALVYADYEALDSLGLNNPDNLKTIMDENLKNLNNSVAAYEKISKIQLYPTEFEKTPKRSIKRYLYNSITID